MALVADRIRVMHLIKGLGRGGAEMLLAEGLRCADRERFDYSFAYFLPWKDALVSDLRTQGADVTCFGSRNNPAILLSARRLARELKRRRIDVLHCHLPMAGAVGRIAGRLAGVPVVYSEHNMQERYHFLTRWLNKTTWNWQKHVVAVSDDVARSIAVHMPAGVPVETVLNGVDTERFHRQNGDGATLRSRFNIPSDAPVVGTVAVFRSQKRLLDWLSACKRIRADHPDAHFFIVGDGPLREEVLAETERLNLTGVVHFPGLQEDVRPFLATFDLYMMASMFEGLPVALLEAMSMECAPVCTAVGGIPEVIESGANGVLVTPGQPYMLAEAASNLLADDKSRMRMASCARTTVVRKYGIARAVRSLEAIYGQIASEHAEKR